MSRATTRNTARHQVTALLQAWGTEDETALQALTPLVEPHLRRLARTYMRRERAGQTLQPTALVNEVSSSSGFLAGSPSMRPLRR